MLVQLLNTLFSSIQQFANYFFPWIQQLANNVLPWLQQYGPVALFFLLALGIIALPIPDESLLVGAGVLMSKGDLALLPTVIAAITGAWCGITVSYWLGIYLGPYIIASRFGKLIGLRGPGFQKVQHWFSRIGKWLLMIGYFIPGVRHFVGYLAGTLGLPYRQFSLFAYTGGAVWSTLFLSLGYLFHQNGHWFATLGKYVGHLVNLH